MISTEPSRNVSSRPQSSSQEAVAAELRRVELNEQADTYLTHLVAEIGEPSARERARADAIARRIRDRAARDAG